MSKLTDFYIHKASLQEEGKTIDPQWEMLEDQLLKEELLPELIEQLKMVFSKVKSPLMFSGSYDPNGCLSVSFTRNCIQMSTMGATKWNLPINIQFQFYLSDHVAKATADSYISTLDNAVRQWIKKEVDEHAESIYSYTTAEDVRLCIEMLNSSPEYVAENDRKHHSMSAALNQYLKFIEEWEERNKNRTL